MRPIPEWKASFVRKGTAMNFPILQPGPGMWVGTVSIGLAVFILNWIIIYMVLKAAIRNAMIEAYEETGRA